MNNFNEYLKKLQCLESEKTLIKKERSVILLSGSSNYKNAALSQIQKEFLNIFEKFGYNVVNSNFPYNEDFKHNDFDDVHILKASISNIVYYWHTLYNINFQKEIKRHLSPLFELENAIIVTQSSGLNLLNCVLKDRNIKEKNFRIFCLGPVAQGSEKIEKAIIFKGKKDMYTKILDNHKCDVRVDCKHFDYLKNKKIKEFIYDTLQKDKS